MTAEDARIFISYRREDSGGHAGRLADDLADHFGREQVFLDVDTIMPGARFPERIRAAVAASAAVIVVIGRGWLAANDAGRRRLDDPNDLVRQEVREALERSKPLFPVLVARAEMPPAGALPEDLADLAEYNALELGNDWRDDLARLIEALEASAVTPPPIEAFPDEPPASRAERRDAWLAHGDQTTVRSRLEQFLRSHGMRSEGWHGDVLWLRGGSRVYTRAFGGFWVDGKRLPTTARIRLIGPGARVAVEALIREDLGKGVFEGMGRRYEAWFDTWMGDLRDVTGASS